MNNPPAAHAAFRPGKRRREASKLSLERCRGSPGVFGTQHDPTTNVGCCAVSSAQPDIQGYHLAIATANQSIYSRETLYIH